MELSTLIGIILGIGAVVGAMFFKGIDFGVLLNPAAILVILVGTVATIFNSFPGKTLKSVGALFKILFTKQKGFSEEQVIDLMVDLSKSARQGGLLALESKVSEIDDPFIQKGIGLVVDGTSESIIEEIL